MTKPPDGVILYVAPLGARTHPHPNPDTNAQTQQEEMVRVHRVFGVQRRDDETCESECNPESTNSEFSHAPGESSQTERNLPRGSRCSGALDHQDLPQGSPKGASPPRWTSTPEDLMPIRIVLDIMGNIVPRWKGTCGTCGWFSPDTADSLGPLTEGHCANDRSDNFTLPVLRSTTCKHHLIVQ